MSIGYKVFRTCDINFIGSGSALFGSSDTIHEIAHLSVGLILDQPVDVRLEPRKALIEIARVLQVADDGAVEALAGDQQWNARRISPAPCRTGTSRS